MPSDRVNELYHRKIHEPATQLACRNRIHWMCAQVVGEDVLDFGCSQGIASLLLGREGHRVVGVDIDPAAIEYALNELDQEPDYVRRNVSFRVVASEQLPFDDESFDTILLGEVIEHLTRPQRALAEVRRLLRPDGRVVVTTPFGIHPDPEHVRTFYLSDFLSMVRGLFETRDLCIVDKTICFVGGRASSGSRRIPKTPHIRQLLALSEEAFLSAEKMYWERREALARQAAETQKRLTNAQSQAESRGKTAHGLANRLADAEQRLARWRAASVAFMQRVRELVREGEVGLGSSVVLRHMDRVLKRIRASPAIDTALESLPELMLQSIELGERQLTDEYEAKLVRQHQAFDERIGKLRQAHQQQLDHLRRDNIDLRQLAAQNEQQSRELRQAHEQGVKKLRSEVQQSRAAQTKAEQAARYYKAELDLKQQEVRYRLGDAFVRACGSPVQLILLPVNLVKLFFVGMRRRHERRKAERREAASSPQASSAANAAPQREHASPAAASKPAVSRPPSAPKVAAERERKFEPVVQPERAPRFPITAAAIMDEFTHECFRGECKVMPVTPQDWKERLTREPPDFLFVESAWRGNGGAWRYRVARSRMIHEDLGALIEWFRSRKIPTVFWNKEDPSDFDQFIHVARHFDHIFTTDENCVPEYRKIAKHDRVYALPFAAQPAIHNPVGTQRNHAGQLCFAGAYYADRHSDRRSDMEMLLKPALKRGLHIYDRMRDVDDDRYRFPEAYRSAIRGSLPYPEMLDAYKRYRVFLNVNIVNDSPTMFSRRVLEILACGTPVISTHALGLERLLGPECVALVESEEQAQQWIDVILNSPEISQRMVLRAQRRIFTEHTYEHRLRTILDKIGKPVPRMPRRVTVVTCTNRPAQLENVIANYERQAYPDKEFVLVCNSDDFNLRQVRERLRSVENARAFQLKESCSLGECLNLALDDIEYEYWTKFDDDNFYAEHFITDMMLPFLYTNAAIVGKYSYYAYLEGQGCLALRYPGIEHQNVTFLSGSAMIVDRMATAELRFPEQNCGEDTSFLRDAVRRGLKLYSADRFNYVVRRSKSLEDHTWKIGDHEFLRDCRVVCYTHDYRPHVVV